MWWLYFLQDNGRPNLRGPYASHMRALDKKDNLDREGELFNFPTSDRSEAAARIREKRADDLGVTEGARNFSHKEMEEYD